MPAALDVDHDKVRAVAMVVGVREAARQFELSEDAVRKWSEREGWFKHTQVVQAAILEKQQTKTYGPRLIAGYGHNATITATVRYDDECGNGHNTFAITAEVKSGKTLEACGCLHNEVARVFPELAPLIKWHLVSSDGPMHYVANTLYWAGKSGWCDGKPGSPPNLAFARSSAVWPEATDEELCQEPEALKAQLLERLPSLMVDFKTAVESLGFTY